MSQLRGLSAAVLIIGAIFARPVAAQSRDNSSSLTHVVSVSVPARVKVSVSSIASRSSESIPAGVTASANSSALALNVDANRRWALSISTSGSTSGRSSVSSLGSAETQSGQFTAVFNPDGNGSSSAVSGQPVVLTVSAP